MKKFFKKIRFSLFFLQTLIKKYKKILLGGILAGILSFLLIPKIIEKISPKKVERIGYAGKFTLNQLPLEIQEKIGEGLVNLSPEGEIIPQIAESWEIANEGKIYIFVLKPNLFWHDGKPIKAADINYSFADVAITPLGENRVKFELKEPFSPFLSIVAQPVFKKGLIGSGEYKVARLKKNGEIVEKIFLIPFKDKTKPKLEIKFYPTEEMLKTAFKLGEVDTIKEVTQPEELISWKKIKIIPEVKYNQFVGIFFNTSNPSLSVKSTRQALAYALEKKWPYRALTPLNPHSWAYNPAVKPYNFDLENARKLLTKSTQENQPEIKEIELSTVSSLLNIAEEIKNDWEKLGINCKIKIINNLEEPFMALLAVQEIPSDPDQYIFWHSTQPLNITRFKSPKIDKLLEEGRKTFDMTKRKEIYQEFQKSLVEEVPAIFLFHPTVYTISRI